MLRGNGRYGAITINSVVLSVQDVQQMLGAGLLQLDPATRRLSIGAGLSSEARFIAALRQVPLSNPQAPRDLYRSSKVAVPLREQRARRPSVFMRPISASMALRRRRSAMSFGVRPRLVPLISARDFSSPWPR